MSGGKGAGYPRGGVGGGSTFGQLLRLHLYLWYALPAFSSGFSVRPPPATCPIIARHVLGMICARDGATVSQGWWQGTTSRRGHTTRSHTAGERAGSLLNQKWDGGF